MKKVIVVGGGIGGLSTAIHLLNKGYKVTIIEKCENIGGKINSFAEEGFKFDLTASILMTPDSYLNIFKECNKDYRDYINVIDLDVLYRVDAFDKTNFKIYSKSSKTLKVLEMLRRNLSRNYVNFLESSINKYNISKEYFLDKPMISLREILNIETIGKTLSLNPLKSNFDYTKNLVGNNKLLEYLLFQSMYIGINPYDNTNIYSAIPAITQLYGLIYIKGGFYSYIKGLEKLIGELGGEIVRNVEVSEIILEDRKVKGVIGNGATYSSDIVVCNADYPYAIENLFKDDVGSINKKDTKNMEYSCSTFILYLGLNDKINGLEVHNIFLNDDFKNGIEDVFKGKLPKKPSLYLYYPSAVDDTLVEEEGNTVLNIIVRVPNLSFEDITWEEEDKEEFRDTIIRAVKKIKGLIHIEDFIEYEKILTPKDLKDKFNLYNGSAFGVSHKLSQSGYFRPHIKGRGTKGLYFIGASTHPGNGASIGIDGGKVLSELIEKENVND